MNILIVANHYAVCSARYATDAFKRLGHSVSHVGPAMGRNIWGLTLPERYVWEPDNDTWGDFRFDLVVVMDSDPAILDDRNYYLDVPIVVWGVDNHVRSYRRPHFQHYFLAHRNVSVMPWEYKQVRSEELEKLDDMIFTTMKRDDPHREIGRITTRQNDDMTHLPCCYDPTIFTTSTIPWPEREYDVAMIGVMYEQRWRAVQELRAAGLKVITGTGLVYENMAAAYQNARISLCLSSNGDVGQRVFESAACGCVVLSDECADFALLKPTGVVRQGMGDLVSGVRMLLENPAHAENLIADTLAWVDGHTWDARAQVVVDWVEAQHAA